MDDKKLLTPEEVAYQLGIGRTTVFDLLATSELDSLKIGRSRRIPVQALVDFIERAKLDTSQNADAS